MRPGIHTELPFELSDLSQGALWALIAIAVLYAALFIYTLLALIRYPEPQLQGASKLIWGLVLVFGNVLGALVVLAVVLVTKKNLREQRRHATELSTPHPDTTAHTPTSSVIEDLYGHPRN